MTEKQKKKEQEKRAVRLIFKDEDDKKATKIITIEGNYYNAGCSYRENVEDLVATMAEDGGLWIGDETIIPFHRVLSVKLIKPSKPKPNRRPPKRKPTRKKAPKPVEPKTED